MIGTRIASATPLVSHADLLTALPLSGLLEERIRDWRRSIARILSGREDRLLVVVGPCSVHNVEEALEYASNLKVLQRLHAKDLEIVMRVYLEKPRTTVGWRGLVNDPHLDGSFDVNAGLRMGRKLLLDIADLGIPAATEFLDTSLCQYYCDLISWGAIGARTVESQVHREVASAMPMPVGFKNRTDGNVQVAVDAIVAAREPHGILAGWGSGAAVLRTTGNPHCNVVLRGGSGGKQNFDRDSIMAATRLCGLANANPFVVVDCSHANSNKQAVFQRAVAENIAASIALGDTFVAGVMLESYLQEGAQKVQQGPAGYRAGVSITDECIDLETTADVLESLAEAVQTRRSKNPHET